ncbi:MAG TPA: hypothetical protein VGA16_07825 [Candidatus Limnocylindria bacterium]
MDRTKAATMGRRSLLRSVGAAGVTAAALFACTPAQTTSSPTARAGAGQPAVTAAAPRPGVVRLSSVVIPQESGLYAEILPEFERRSGLKVEVATATDVHGPARSGNADIVLSHYQHDGVAPFMQEGFGEWPRMVFSSPGVIVGPKADPAKIRGSSDAVEAFRLINGSGAPFVVNDTDGLRHVAEVIARSAGLSTSAGWYVDKGTRGPLAMQAAAQSGGYSMWGLVPFLRTQKQASLPLEPLMTRDQILKSVMVTIVVSDKKVAGVNAAGATALQRYLIEPETQARIRTFRMAGVTEQVWWPAAQDNDKAAFGK